MEFEKERLERYFNESNLGEDDSYINEVFYDNIKESELKRYLSRHFNELSQEDEDSDKNLDHILYKIHYDINTRLAVPRKWSFENIIKWSFRIAGLIMLPLLVFFGFHAYEESHLKKEAWVEIKAPAWTRAEFMLPDGTKGWLNSNSSVKYNGSFFADRQVFLKGEAFFDVFEDKTRPFKVNTNEIVVNVLGTRFGIASYENEKNVEVVLEKGELKLDNKFNGFSLVMKPNELVVYNKTLNEFSTMEVEPQKYISWTEGKLIFRNDPVDVIARRLERWYNVDVEVKGNILCALRLRATFKDESLEEVLDLLRQSLNIDYSIVNRDLKTDNTFSKKKVILEL